VSFLAIVFVVLMLFWLFFGAYLSWPATPGAPAYAPLAGTLLPWLCVAILGYAVFSGGVVVYRPVL
jgi:hypothetical protein